MGLADITVEAIVPWYVRWPLKVLGGIKSAIVWAFSSPARLLLILAVAMGVIAYAEHRSAAKWEAQAVKVARILSDERAAAQAAKAKAEQHYKDLAHDADQNHAALQAQGDARLAAYIAAHRLRIAAPADPASPAQGGNPAIPESPSPSPNVATIGISEADLKICDQNYVYAQAAHDWANGLNH
jgi:hypothetical protein